jgi:hypothetical protein
MSRFSSCFFSSSLESSSARVSSCEGFRTPALGARRTVTHRAGIRNPSPLRTVVWTGDARDTRPAADVRLRARGSETMEYPTAGSHALILAARTTLPHFSASAAMCAPN